MLGADERYVTQLREIKKLASANEDKLVKIFVRLHFDAEGPMKYRFSDYFFHPGLQRTMCFLS